MIIYVVIEAIVGVVVGIALATRAKRADGRAYGRLDRAGRVTNALLAAFYAIASPFYLFLGVISEPSGEGVLIVLGVIVSVIAASASLLCSLGLGLSVALRRKGKSGISFAVQFAGLGGIALTLLLYVAFAGSLISPLN